MYYLRYSAIAILFWFSLSRPMFVAGQQNINVVTSLPDFSSIAEEVGGKYVSTFAIAKGYQDPHFVDPKPSYMVKLQKADMFVAAGLDLEQGWVPLLLEGARNADILPGGKGYVDASFNVPLLEVPSADPATLRSQGDIHVFGNPHYWLDPVRGKIIAANIHAGLVRLRPELKAYFDKSLERFGEQIDLRTKTWQEKLTKESRLEIAAYHNSWPYFAERFGISIKVFVEPKPGIPPSPKHLAYVIGQVKQQRLKMIVIEPYYSKKSSELVAEKADVPLLELGGSVGAHPEIMTYFDLFEYNIEKIAQALEAR